MQLDPITATRYFDQVLATVRQYQAEMGAAKVAPLNFDESHGGGPVKVGNFKAEYVAEFANCGKRVLFPWPKRLQLFESYFVEGGITKLDYAALLDETERTVIFWCRQIKRTVGCEVYRQGLVRRKHKDLMIDEDLEALGKR